MPDPITGLIAGGTIITGQLSANAQSKAAEGASQAQLEASKLGIEDAEIEKQIEKLCQN